MPASAPDRISLWMATLFGVGFVPKFPGTAASLLTLPVVYVLYSMGIWVYLAVALVVSVLAVPVCGRASKILNHPDPSVIVLDEVAGMLIAAMPGLMMCASPGHRWIFLFIAFVCFRWFDIRKPGWIGKIQDVHGGAGIVLDDVLAGLAAAAISGLVYLAI